MYDLLLQNPQVDVSSSDRVDWESDPGFAQANVASWENFAAYVTAEAIYHTNACFICGCFRTIGCFAPGVKITMADGSLRNIEDVRAGDLVRNTKTAPL